MKIELSTLQAKSDQMNAVDFVQPMTFRVSAVDYNPRQEQPILIHLEGCEGRPFKPCKSMLRGLAAIWSDETTNWHGKLIELYCDPSVKWAGKEAGGIRISSVSGITQPYRFTVALNKSQRYIHTFNALEDSASIKKEFIFTHWESDINEAKDNDAINKIVQSVNNQFGTEALGQLKETVLSARAKFESTE